MSEPQFFSEHRHQPFRLEGNSARGALLMHGFPGTPAEMRPLAEALAAHGWTARGPLLPGFGPDIPTLGEYRRRDWLAAMRREWSALHSEHAATALIGYSMGGAIAIQLAADLEPDFLVLIAPFWRAHDWRMRLVPVLKYIMPTVAPFKDADFDDPDVRRQFAQIAPDLDLDDPAVQDELRERIKLPTAVIDEIRRLGREAYRLASRITAPTLVIQGREDVTVLPQHTRRLTGQLNGRTTLREISGEHTFVHAHNPQHTQVARLVVEFVQREA